MNEWSDEATPTGTPRTRHENSLDLHYLQSIALHDCPMWAEDIITRTPEAACIAPHTMPLAADEHVRVSHREAPAPIHARTTIQRTTIVTECPLHTAMRHLTEAAVAQHVLYMEGEVRPRPDLVEAIARWERLHTMIRECVCPATREIVVRAPALAEIVDTTLGETCTQAERDIRARFIQALDACSACASTAECPLCVELPTE